MATKSTKRPTKKSNSKAAKSNSVQPFRLQPETEPFMTFRLNRQTLYWVIIGAVALLFAAWIMKLQSDIQTVYDRIDIQNAQDYTPVTHSKK